MDKLWAMEVFVRVMECGSFSRAAESLDLANATVTSSLRNLEKHLSVTLIQRNTRHLRLTEEGDLFLPRCLEILKSVAQLESDVKIHATEIAGLLRVECPFAIGQTLLCPALPELARRHPGMSVAVNLTNEPHNLIERATDVAIRMDRVEDADLVARPIYEARYIVCGAPATVRRLRKLDPQLKVVLMSGTESGSLYAEASSLGMEAFLRKPFTAAPLLTTLQSVLSQPVTHESKP